jgi:hypothetical protein
MKHGVIVLPRTYIRVVIHQAAIQKRFPQFNTLYTHLEKIANFPSGLSRCLQMMLLNPPLRPAPKSTRPVAPLLPLPMVDPSAQRSPENLPFPVRYCPTSLTGCKPSRRDFFPVPGTYNYLKRTSNPRSLSRYCNTRTSYRLYNKSFGATPAGRNLCRKKICRPITGE